MKKVYGYIRVSTVKQGDGVSLIAQKEAITNYATKYNLNIIQWFEEMETAAKQGRPLFMTMMKLLRTKKADGVIIHKIDRGARNLKDWADLGNLIDQGVEVHFAHESLDLQARGGRLSADIQAVIAADYIRNLRQEAIKGLYGRLKQGIYPFQAPTGYVDTGKGNFKGIDPIQAPLVKKAFELYATRQYTLRTLCDHMYLLGLRNIRHKKLNINGLSLVLNNPFYMGIIKVKGVSFNGGHEPIILPELFNQVQEVLESKTNQKVQKPEFVFRKMLTCKYCGYTLIPETQKGHVYYRCHTSGCVTKGMRETTINNLLSKAFVTAQLYPEECETLNALLKETEQKWAAKQQELVAAIQLKTGQTQQRLERLTDCYVEGGLDKETYELRKINLLQESKTDEAAQKELLSGNGKILRKTRRFLELSKSLIESFEIANMPEQREMIEITTSNLMVSGKHLIVAMRSPFSELSNRFDFTFGAPQRGEPRIMSPKLVYSEINTSPILGQPLSKENLKSLLNLIFEQVAQLPDSGAELEYDI
jgi:DNA invertase Pin-like site-specific DNA recombinase